MSHELAKAISKQPLPPCEKYKCEFVEICAAEHLACEAFHTYVVTGRTLRPGDNLPTNKQYRKVFYEAGETA